MRLFIGVELEHRVKAAAGDVAERLRQRLQRAAPDFVARWVSPENLHITLWFIGEVADERAATIEEVLRQPFDTATFELALAGCGAFPSSGPPRVVWIGVGQGQGSMSALYGDLGGRLAPLGFQPEHRAYTAHLTIARVKDAGRGTSRTVRQTLAELPADCGTTSISAVTLFRSRLSPRGAAYEPLLRVPLS